MQLSFPFPEGETEAQTHSPPAHPAVQDVVFGFSSESSTFTDPAVEASVRTRPLTLGCGLGGSPERGEAGEPDEGLSVAQAGPGSLCPEGAVQFPEPPMGAPRGREIIAAPVSANS